MNLRVSVGRRLYRLVGCQTAIAVLLVLVAYRTISNAEADYRHMLNFQFKPVVAIGDAMKEAATLKSGSQSATLDAFYRHYRKEWETASGTTPDAIQFRKDLLKAGAEDLPRQESEVLDNLHRSLEDGKADGVRKNLAALYDLSVKYADLDNYYVLDRARRGRVELVVIGLAGIVSTLLLGVQVQRAIIPRAKKMIEHIRHFQESGTLERIGDNGNDDIAVLANALDAGFAAIASRERDRSQFLAVVAHELKTPVTSIYGYASLLVRNSMSTSEMDIAIEAINRQAWRLIRLIDSVLLTSKVPSRDLHFDPAPLNLSQLVARVMGEMIPLLSGKTFLQQIDPHISILGDEALLEHALWSLFISASAYTGKETPLTLSLCSVQSEARLTIGIDGRKVSAVQVQELLTPFGFVEYETGNGIRSAIGLYLCREIIRLHNGTLRVEQGAELPPEFLVKLPI